MSQLLLADRPRPLLLQYRRTFADTVRDLTRQRPDLMATDLGVVSDSTFAVSFSGSVEVSVDSDQSASPRRMFIIDSMATLETAITDIDEKMRQELDRQLHETQDEMVARSRAADAVGLTEFSYQSMWRTPRGVRSGRFSAPNGEILSIAFCSNLFRFKLF